jgi:thiosulfate/3-mercaptopyruvate sulfurtransferase
MRKLFSAGFFIFSLSAGAQPVTIPLEKAPKVLPKPTPAFVGPVVLDTRPAFKFSMEHHAGAVPVRWEDFSQTEEPLKGKLDSNEHLLVRKFRTLGVSPDREIVILGQGASGWGEEGRIAWMLKYLGVNNIRVERFDQFPGKKVFGSAESSYGGTPWKASPNEFIRAMKSDVVRVVKDKPKNITLVDVRAADEFSGQKAFGEKRLGHIPGAINIPWERFVSSSGKPADAEQVKKILTGAGVPLDNEIIFYCTGGVRSGYATFASLLAGLKARNFDGGIWEYSADADLPLLK